MWLSMRITALFQAKMLVITGLLIGMGLGLSASERRVPLKEIVIYLDNSKSIVNEKSDRPSIKLAAMLRAALSKDVGFLNDNDLISIYNFGSTIDSSRSRSGVAGSQADDWGLAIDDFAAARPGDSRTNLSEVLGHIADTATRPTSEGRLRIFIVASDFVHDPTDEVSSSNLKNSEQTARVRDQLSGEIRSSMASLANASGSYFLGENPNNFLLLLKVPPLVLKSSSQNYVATANHLATTLTGGLVNEVDATVQNYREGAMSGEDFARKVLQKITRWLKLEAIAMSNGVDGSPKLKLRVHNPNVFPINLLEIGVAVDESAQPSFQKVQAFSALPGDQNLIEVDTEAWGAIARRPTLYFSVKQDPAPSGVSQHTTVDGMSWAGVTLTDIQVIALGLNQPLLIVRGAATVKDEQLDKTSLSLRLALRHKVNPALVFEPDVSLLAVPLDQGQGRAELNLAFDDEAIDTYDLTQYELVVSIDASPPKEHVRQLGGQHVIRPSWWFCGVIGVLFFAFFLYSRLMPEPRPKPDLLLLLGLLLLLAACLLALLPPPLYRTYYPLLFGFFPALLAALWAFRVMLDRFSASLARQRDQERIDLNDFTAQFTRNRLLITVPLFLAMWYIAANFVF